ncbi:MAG: helix-turn-helix domain-containing protein [Candidatus Devosia phytovorans]|uniref:Helix-turn-helix domain-containing protein n=1 Tax=Candidatus Devosia phytovorans TaxID=3121372 RepID=A0AAJ5VYN8_9HYPH|nr:helix-turn-helix domain-containing protein [Devosia sp.]WEK06300.1 MAG: helix-turn-helix domain-containing protein [Devosia sp.]
MPDIQPRKIATVTPDPTALKALAHPMRLRMLGLLRIDGPATASGLAERLGLNSGATSYHLRQLALHGFIEEDAERGNARDRWWRARHEVTNYLAREAEGEALEVGLAFGQAALNWQITQMQGALANYPELAPEWRSASTASDYTMALTAGQAEVLIKKILGLLEEAGASAPALGSELPKGTRPFSIILHAAPHVSEDKP